MCSCATSLKSAVISFGPTLAHGLGTIFAPILQRGKLRLRKIEFWVEVAPAATVTTADGIFGVCCVPKHFTHSPRADRPME